MRDEIVKLQQRNEKLELLAKTLKSLGFESESMVLLRNQIFEIENKVKRAQIEAEETERKVTTKLTNQFTS